MTKFTALSAAALTLGLAFSVPATGFAAGEETPPTTKKCSKGKVLDKQSGKCVQAESNLLDADERYEAVREYAYAGEYDNAATILASFANQNDPRVQNYLGFIARKKGDMNTAMHHYAAALSIDPDYILARSYMGQGLISMGDSEGARAQLAEIRQRGGRNTWAYTALAMALRGVPTNY